MQHTQKDAYPIHPEPPKGRKNVYDFHELQVDLGQRVLRNTVKDITKDLVGFNYTFLRLLLEADGNLIPYATIADTVRDGTVGLLTEKQIMDRKSGLIGLLKEQLQISESVADAFIEGKGGYRISRTVYE